MILWENLQIGSFSRFIRTLFVALITIILLVASVGGIVISQYYQNEASNQFSISACSQGVTVTMEQAFNDTLLPSTLQAGLLNCYCYDQLLTIG